MIGERFGSKWRQMIRRSRAPIARAAITYSLSLNSKAGARSVRAKIGVYTIAMAMAVLAAPGPRTAITPMASRITGKANSTSIRRIATLSAQPPRQAASTPTLPPTASAAKTDSTEIANSVR